MKRVLRGYTIEEDNRLLALRAGGASWEEIAAKMPARPPASLRGRYGQITKTAARTGPPWIDTDDFKSQCEAHRVAVMRHGGFCAFTDNGDKRGAFGITLPMIWPKN